MLIPRVVLALGVPLELRTVEIDLSQITRAVAFRLVIEVRRRRVAALPTGGHGSGPHRLAELDDGDEAVAAGAVNPLRARVRAGAERGQRAPRGGGEAYGNARPGVGEGVNDVVGQALEAVDLAPGRLPGSEVGRELVRRRGGRLEELVRRRFVGDIVSGGQSHAPDLTLNIFP